MTKKYELEKVIGKVIVEVDAENINVIFENGVECRARLRCDIIELYRFVEVRGQKLNGLLISADMSEDIKNTVKQAKLDKFLNEEQTINYHYGYGYSLSDSPTVYSDKVLQKVYEENKVKNDNYNPFDDGFTVPYEFPKMLGKDLVKLIEAAEKEVEEAKAEAKRIAEAKLQAKFDEAKKTGNPVLIKSEGGMDSDNFDRGWAYAIMTYAMPDGTKKIEKVKEIWD